MKKLIIVLVLLGFAVTAYSFQDVYVYEAPNGNVTFDHDAHQEEIKCDVCHVNTDKIVVDKNSAHGPTCKGCHRVDDGPISCRGCHIK
ncbi:MAG TPA: cytochrome c3 family protein [Massilibacterium sp.]|nr:cytochrome c3 family protein [Massilibacterium sp.]